MKYILIHGTMGHTEENRFPWLKEKLEEGGHTVFVPQFPTPENQNLESRCTTLTTEVPFVFDTDTVLIGHSLGALYILHILDRKRELPLSKVVLVSGFINALGNKTFDDLNKPFLKENFDWDRIKNNSKDIVLFHGENDPYVPLSEAKNLQERLSADLHIIADGGHLNESAGFKKFDALLKIL